MTEILKKIPKVELHLHLEGSIRLETLHEIATELGPKYGIPQMSLEKARQHFCIKQKTDSLTSFIQKFLNTQAFLISYDIIERIAFEACQDSYNNGVVLLEIRYSPDFIIETFTVDHSHLTLEGVHEGVLRGVQKAREKYDIAVGIIGIFDRSKDKEHAQTMLEFYKKHAKEFVGVDLANDEKYPLAPFAFCFEELKKLGLGITIHAGEAGPAENIREAINLGATRIGHGIRILDDPSIVQLAKDKNILLELCPLSNSRTGVIPSYKDHPIRELMNSELLLCINTDDYGIFNSDIIEEYLLLQNHFGITLNEFRQFNINALKASFLDSSIKDSVLNKYFK